MRYLWLALFVCFLTGCEDFRGFADTEMAPSGPGSGMDPMDPVPPDTVEDGFEDGVVNPTIWTEDAPVKGSSAQETGGSYEMRDRPLLNTLDDWQPDTGASEAPVTVELDFRLGGDMSVLTIVVRSDGQSFGPQADPSNGIRIDIENQADLVRLTQVVANLSTSLGSVPYVFTTGTAYRIRIVDSGTSVRIFIDNLDDPADDEEAENALVNVPVGAGFVRNLVTFLNGFGGLDPDRLDRVRLSGKRTPVSTK